MLLGKAAVKCLKKRPKNVHLACLISLEVGLVCFCWGDIFREKGTVSSEILGLMVL